MDHAVFVQRIHRPDYLAPNSPYRMVFDEDFSQCNVPREKKMPHS